MLKVAASINTIANKIRPLESGVSNGPFLLSVRNILGPVGVDPIRQVDDGHPSGSGVVGEVGHDEVDQLVSVLLNSFFSSATKTIYKLWKDWVFTWHVIVNVTAPIYVNHKSITSTLSSCTCSLKVNIGRQNNSIVAEVWQAQEEYS